MIKRILQNQVKCYACGDMPYSAHRHDFKYCRCGAVAVDGGLDYLRRAGGEEFGYKEMSIVIDEAWMPELRAVAKDFKEDRLTELGLICHMARLFRDSEALS